MHDGVNNYDAKFRHECKKGESHGKQADIFKEKPLNRNSRGIVASIICMRYYQ